MTYNSPLRLSLLIFNRKIQGKWRVNDQKKLEGKMKMIKKLTHKLISGGPPLDAVRLATGQTLYRLMNNRLGTLQNRCGWQQRGPE